MGELSATAYAAKMFPNRQRLESKTPGNGQQGQFDQIYMDGDRVVIIEAKGGRAELGAARDLNGDFAQQGSKSYMEAIIQNYRDKADAARRAGTPDVKLESTAAALESAFRFEKIDYFAVKQRNSDLGVADTFELTKFNIW